MAFVHFDSNYAPGGFLIVKDGADPRDERSTILIQIDWDYPAIASTMGWQACPCGETDGTVNCQHRKAFEMIAEAFEYIEAREGQSFPALDEYFTSN